MAETSDAPASSKSKFRSSKVDLCHVICAAYESVKMRKEQWECPCFRILVIGRANAGKTTILEKVCGVAHGTKPIIFDQNDDELKFEPEPEPKLKKKFFGNMKHLWNRKTALAPSGNSTPSVTSSISAPSTYLTPSIEVSQGVNVSIH